MTKTALVTGSAGFIGRHMARELESRGYNVETVDIAYRELVLPTDDAHWHFRHSTVVYDLVVHCAYHVGGRAAIDGTNLNFMKNVQLDSAMFEWAVRTKQKRVLYFSSSAVYPVAFQTQEYVTDPHNDAWYNDRNWRQLHEDQVDISLNNYVVIDWDVYAGPAPDANYGFAKLVGERLAEDARRNGLRVSVVRPFSGYGEDQDLNYPFPSIVSRARQGDLSVWGPPGQARDWIYVDDVVKGALAVVEAGTKEPVNLCTGVATEMGELAESIAAEAHLFDCMKYPGINPRRDKVTYLEDKPTGVFYRVGDPTRMLQYYTPQVSLEDGILRALRHQSQTS